MNDLRYSLRQLLKHPGFTFVAIVTLALKSARTPRFSASSTPSFCGPCLIRNRIASCLFASAQIFSIPVG